MWINFINIMLSKMRDTKSIPIYINFKIRQNYSMLFKIRTLANAKRPQWIPGDGKYRKNH